MYCPGGGRRASKTLVSRGIASVLLAGFPRNRRLKYGGASGGVEVQQTVGRVILFICHQQVCL